MEHKPNHGHRKGLGYRDTNHSAWKHQVKKGILRGKDRIYWGIWRFFQEKSSGKDLLRVLTAGLVLTAVFYLFPFFASCDQLSREIIRLHVVANSDSPMDQALKYQIRDAVLLASAEWYQGASDIQEAEQALQLHLKEIEQVAQSVATASGSKDSVQVQMTDMYFETRDYETFSLPAGNYRSLRVVIGEGAGKNWWCMVYPALCIPAAQGAEGVLGSDPAAASDLAAYFAQADEEEVRSFLRELEKLQEAGADLADPEKSAVKGESGTEASAKNPAKEEGASFGGRNQRKSARRQGGPEHGQRVEAKQSTSREPSEKIPAPKGIAETDPAVLGNLTAAQQKIIRNPEQYEVRLKLVEWIQALREKLEQ